MKKVMVLILSYNGKELLQDSIISYLNNDYSNFQVVVIDNGSTDSSKEWVESNFPKVHVLRTETNLGYSGGFNFGLEYAFNTEKVDYVLITNNDVKVDSKVISELVKVAESDSLIGFTTGKVYYYDNPNILQTVGKNEDPIKWNGTHIGNKEIDEGQYDGIAERIFADDIFMLVSREVYESVGGYDTTFQFQSEEFDWQARAKKHGYKIFYTPNAKIWHKDSMTIGKKSAFKAYYDSRNPLLVILKHKEPDYFLKYFRWHLKKAVIRRSLVAVKQLRFDICISIWRGFLSALIYGISNHLFTSGHFLKWKANIKKQKSTS
jgi:GT2 family glycosyltransferase